MTNQRIWSSRYEFLFTPDFDDRRGEGAFLEHEEDGEAPERDQNISRNDDIRRQR